MIGSAGTTLDDETITGKINWYYSDGKWGGSHGGHYMSTFEFLKFNNLL